jgi:hypothetical protein
MPLKKTQIDEIVRKLQQARQDGRAAVEALTSLLQRTSSAHPSQDEDNDHAAHKQLAERLDIKARSSWTPE